MIRGTVEENNVRIPLVLRGFTGRQVAIEAVVDTGFDGYLSVPINVIQALDLLKTEEADVTLANGMVFIEDVYTVIVEWDGVEQLVLAAASDPDTLVGMALMRGYNLSVDVEEGGQVRLSRLGGELQTPAGLESGL